MFSVSPSRRRRAFALVCAGSLFAVSACSSSGGGDAAPVASSTTTASVARPDRHRPRRPTAVRATSSRAWPKPGLGSKGAGIVYAMKADRYEVVGDELHVYLGDKTSAPEGTECMIASAVLSPGETVVIHKNDTVTPCE